jgi:hypothetical protein
MTCDTARAAVLRRKVAWRITPLVILLYLVAYLDGANVGSRSCAWLATCNSPTKSSGIGIFFLGYLTLEIPGALLVERWSARKWFARILITWLSDTSLYMVGSYFPKAARARCCRPCTPMNARGITFQRTVGSGPATLPPAVSFRQLATKSSRPLLQSASRPTVLRGSKTPVRR